MSAEFSHGPFRRWLGGHPRLLRLYRGLIGWFGGWLLAVGIVLLPLPGPGWVIIFLALGILSTEYAWARRAALVLRRIWAKVQQWGAKRRERRARRETKALKREVRREIEDEQRQNQALKSAK